MQRPDETRPQSDEEAAFLVAIRDEPDSDCPRLAYARWLEHRGDPLGEFIRSQCACDCFCCWEGIVMDDRPSDAYGLARIFHRRS